MKFHLDLGIGDVVPDPLEQTLMRDWLGFAGIPPPSVPMIQREHPDCGTQQPDARSGRYGSADSIQHS